MFNPNWPDAHSDQLTHFVRTGDDSHPTPGYGYSDSEEYRGHVITRRWKESGFQIMTPVAFGCDTVIHTGWMYGNTVDALKAKMDMVLDHGAIQGHPHYLVKSLDDADVLAAIGPAYRPEVFQDNGAVRFVRAAVAIPTDREF